jgi:hypothetical protein
MNQGTVSTDSKSSTQSCLRQMNKTMGGIPHFEARQTRSSKAWKDDTMKTKPHFTIGTTEHERKTSLNSTCKQIDKLLLLVGFC